MEYEAKEYETVIIAQPIPPESPHYVKPDIGVHCFSKSKLMLCWEDVAPLAWENYDWPEFTLIHYPGLGTLNLDMNHEDVCERIKKGQERRAKQTAAFHNDYVGALRSSTK